MSQEFEYKVINKHLLLTRRNSNCSWQEEPNLFEAVKAQTIWGAKDSSKQYLPRFAIEINEEKYPHLVDWRDAFTSDNPPEQVSFRGRDQELADAIKDIDFSKPYDDEIAQALRARFTKIATKKIQVDADLIIMGELGELDDGDKT